MTRPDLFPFGVTVEGKPVAPPLRYDDAALVARAEHLQAFAGAEGGVRSFINDLVAFFRPNRFGDVNDLPRALLRQPHHPEVGWGLVFDETIPSAIRDALQPLLNHRQGIALEDWQALDTLDTWLDRHDVNLLNQDLTESLPYYILIVGSPQIIPYASQYELARLRAVGRLYLGTDPADYESYGAGVLAHEQAPKVARRALFLSAKNAGDLATQLSANHLVPALAKVPGNDADLAPLNYKIDQVPDLDLAGMRQALDRNVHGGAPALIFAASHGISFPSGAAQQSTDQGSWVLSNWAGGSVSRDAYLAPGDIDEDCHTPGSIIFTLACYGAGTNQLSEYAPHHNKVFTARPLAEKLAPSSFVAGLPQRLLSFRNNGEAAGALAYIGHVDLSWAYSFWEQQELHSVIFDTVISRLLRGDTAGMAVNRFSDEVNKQNAALTQFADNFGGLDIGQAMNVAQTWIRRNNARGFIVLGDPAVRIDPDKLP